jgi:capsular polysaccharide biosynthesis protein
MSASTQSPDLPPPLRLADAASRSVDFEQSCLFHSDAETRLSEALLDHPNGQAYFATRNVTTQVRSHVLENVELNGDTLVLSRDGREIPESAYFVSAAKRDADITEMELVQLEDDADYVLAYNNAFLNYQHWLTQCLPAIDWAVRQQRTRGLKLILPRLEPWQEAFLALLNYQSIPRFTPDPSKRYTVPHLEFADFLYGATSFGVCLSGYQTARRVLDTVPRLPRSDKVIYVPCTVPYYGSISNEDEVIALLQRRGVLIVDQQAMTIRDRLNLFREADVVMGPLGLGLADILFCKPGTLMWEWMPEHHLNPSYHCLAQAARVEYWGDLFRQNLSASQPGSWRIDTGLLNQRLTEISSRTAHRAAAANERRLQQEAAPAASGPTNIPLSDLMLAFETLGDNAEFGTIQRRYNAEPDDLLRFATMTAPLHMRLDTLVAALTSGFQDLGDPSALSVELVGAPGQAQFMVHEASYGLIYPSGVQEGAIEPEALVTREARRLAVLRDRLLDELASGEKIWIWRSPATTHLEQIQPLVTALRSLGPNVLLWVVEQDERHPPGSVEPLGSDLLRGYVERFAPDDHPDGVRPDAWLTMCESALQMCHPERFVLQAEQRMVADRQAPVSALDFLARNQSVIPETERPRVSMEPPGILTKAWRYLRGER